MKPHPSIKFVALGLFGIAGFFAGRISSPAPGSGADSSVDSKSLRTTPRMVGEIAGSKEKSRTVRATRTGSPVSPDRLVRLESILRNESALDRNRALLAFIDQLAPDDFPEAIEHFRSLGLDDNRNGDLALLLSAWAKTDPLTAVTYARENMRGGFATNTILTTWATNDPAAAIQWATANHEGEGGNRFFAGIIRGLAASDPARATDLLASMPRGDERGDALEEMVPHVLQGGPNAAQMWVSNIGDEVLRNSLMMEMAEPMADKDPKSTAEWLLANPGEASNRRSDDVFERWAEKDPQAALASFATLPAGEFRSNALEGIVGTLAEQDPKAAAAMLDRYPNDVTEDVVQSVVWDSLQNDPVTAVNQIARLTDEGQRDRMYSRALGRWMERDPGGVDAWLQQNPVSENVLNQLARQQDRNRQ